MIKAIRRLPAVVPETGSDRDHERSSSSRPVEPHRTCTARPFAALFGVRWSSSPSTSDTPTPLEADFGTHASGNIDTDREIIIV